MKTKTIVEKRKSVTLKVEGDTLIIRRPFYISDEVVESFIVKKKEWIDKQLKLNQVFEVSFETDLILMDSPIKLVFKKGEENRIIKHETVWTVISKTEKSGLNLVQDNLRGMLHKKIEEYIKVLQSIKPFQVNQIKIKNLKSSWGNCNSRKELSFALRLIHMKESFIESVIAHEVSHLFVMNHSASFYRVLSQFDPDYRSSIKDLSGQ